MVKSKDKINSLKHPYSKVRKFYLKIQENPYLLVTKNII